MTLHDLALYAVSGLAVALAVCARRDAARAKALAEYAVDRLDAHAAAASDACLLSQDARDQCERLTGEVAWLLDRARREDAGRKTRIPPDAWRKN